MNPTYTFSTATWEIILLLLAAFLLGMLLCRLLRTLGICCTGTAPTQATGRGYGFPSSGTDGGYTQDINSLLRDPNPSPRQPVNLNSPLGAKLASSAANVGVAGLATVTSIGSGRKDDLKKLEGIGPKIEQLLNAAGIHGFEQLSAATPNVLKSILGAAGGQFGLHDPKSWPYQAELAAKGEWESLKEYQNLLISGKTE